MQELIDSLPDHPIGVNECFELMTPPRTVGFVSPYFKSEGKCVAFYFEHEGQIKAVGFTGSTWEQVGPTHDVVDDIIHDREICEVFMDEFYDDFISQYDGEVETIDIDVQFDAPTGFQFKICVRHRGLSSDDYDGLVSFPQFVDVEAIWGNPDDGVVGICVIERRLHEPSDSGVLFAYYNPDLGTWRIVDVVSDPHSGVADQVHGETKDMLESYYDTLEQIWGPA